MFYIDFEWLLGSFRGRASRYHFAVGLLIVGALLALAFFAFRTGQLTFCTMDPHSTRGRIYFVSLVVIGLILTWSGTAILGKRLQDRGIPGALAVVPWLGLWIAPLVARLEVDGACAALTPLRIGVGGGALGLLGLFILWGLFMPGSRFGNRYGDSLRRSRMPKTDDE